MTASGRVLERAVYRGPHLYSRTPMIRIVLDLGILEEWPTHKISQFSEKLLPLLPGLHNHGCSYGEPDGFVKRLAEGTWLGHVVEHIALELQSIAESTVTRGKTRSVRNRPGVYNVMFGYDEENVGLWAGRYAIELVNSLLPETLPGITDIEKIIGGTQTGSFSLNEAINKLKAIAFRERLGPSTYSIVNAAKQRGIPFTRLDNQSLIQLGTGKYQRRIRGSITDAASLITVEMASDKALTKNLLAVAGVPVPEGEVVQEADEAVRAAAKCGYPVVIKPLDSNQGKGVSTHLTNEEQVREAFERAVQYSRNVIVEQHFDGSDYRVLLVNHKLVAAAERIPAHIIGDGSRTIAALIEALNSDPRRGDEHESILTKVVIDRRLRKKLASVGLSLESIPEKGQTIWLCDTANLSTGGTAIDRTDHIHPANVALMERASRTIGLDVAGIDVIAEDISLPLTEQKGGVLEVNASPGLRMHLYPSEGTPRSAGEAIVSMLFPEAARSCIPIAAITGTNGKSTATRMVAHILRQNNHTVGLTSTSGIYVNDDMLWKGDASGPQSARLLLRNPSIDYAVLETARGGILREGLAFNKCDVGAVLNISADHIGLGGVETLEDLAAAKAVVVEAVQEQGVSVLNADDPFTRGMVQKAGGRVCFFSMQGGHKMSDHLRGHIDNGNMAVVYEDWNNHEIVIHEGRKRIPLLDARRIPATLEGIVSFNIQNALAVVAVSYGLGVDIETISNGLASFASSFEQNPGRLNIFDGHGFRVVMDYAHNPAALSALLNVARHMRDKYHHVIGSVSTPGDRQDDHIREMGRIAAGGFDFLVFREGPDARGRPAGEVVRLLAEGAREAGFNEENLVCVIEEQEATDICLQRAGPDDLVVLTPTTVDSEWKRMMAFKPSYTPRVQNKGREARHV